jgi:hypothetical protein
MTSYQEFLARKAVAARQVGIEVDVDLVHPSLHAWQARIVTWAVRAGRAAIWADTGLGKTRMQLEWARLSADTTLLVAPLAVCAQTVQEAARIGITARYVRDGAAVDGPGIWVTNYEMVEHFDPTRLGAVVLDESSILKDVTSKTRDKLIAHFGGVPRRLCCSATPAPNDVAELANHAEFLGTATRREMLSTYFIHDQDGWRAKGHARAPMFRWMSTWAVALRRPSDIGYSDDGYVLPELRITPQLIPVDLPAPEGQLFATTLGGVGGRAAVRRATLDARVDRAVEIANDCRRAEAPVHGGLVRPEQGSSEGVPGGDERSAQRPTAGAIRTGGRAPRADEVGCSELPSPKPVGPPSVDVQPGSVGAGADARPGLLGLQGASGSGLDLPVARGPRSQDGHGPWCSLSVLQLGAGTSGRRPDPGDGAVRVPHACQDQWLIWCGLNDEQDALAEVFGEQCVSIQGKTPWRKKLEREQAWREGHVRILVTKPDVYAHGMNWQHCARMVFVGLNDSYESYYQAIRRCWRYGQTRPVDVHIVLSELEGQIATNVTRKEREAARFTGELVAAMNATRTGVAA